MKSVKLLNLNCRQASRLVSEGMDRDLCFMERLGLRLHLMICSACRAWRRQVLLIRRLLRSGTDDATLTPMARQRILAALEGETGH
jgi:predicted anti-sigma-YlaC factor YlaD